MYIKFIETDWNMKEIGEVQTFQLFRHKMETSTWKGENTRPHFWCFEMLKQWDYMYIGKLLKRTETWRKLVKSKRFSCFDTKWKQALEKVKIPCPISGVSKYWNNKIYVGWTYDSKMFQKGKVRFEASCPVLWQVLMFFFSLSIIIFVVPW